MDNHSPGSVRRSHSHRKRISALHLSSDSVPPLPLYSSSLPGPTWQPPSLDDLPLDKPPDYPDSSQEADADESDQDIHEPNAPPISPRRRKFLSRSTQRHNHHHTSSDLYLDSLLARSVHALEMSNTLLMSNMSTQSSLSALLSSESSADRVLEDRTRDLSSRIKRNRNVHETWMDDIDDIGKRVDGLFGNEEQVDHSEDSVSRSLPMSGLAPLAERHHRRRPSLQVIPPPEGHLDYSKHDRSSFISPAPRALTVYIDSNDNPNAIKLPSTLGHRSPTLSTHFVHSSLPECSTSPRRASFDDTCTSDFPHRAYDILSSYVTPSATGTVSSSISTPRDSRSPSKRRSSTSTLERQSSPSTPRLSHRSRSDSSTTPKGARGRSLTPLCMEPPPLFPRPMTPPIEELSSASNSSSSDTKYAVRSLRKILDDQAHAEQAKLAQSASGASIPTSPSRNHLRPPALLPHGSAAPIASTSHATASVSRLLTKGTHSSSTRPPSPPRHSSLKAPSASASPMQSRSSSLLSVPGFFGATSPLSGHSGRSTPSRVTFAELPESYASSKPEGSSTRFKERKKERKKGKGKASSKKEEEDDGSDGWWGSWLLSGGLTGGRQEEKVEERAARWSMRPPGTGVGGGMDEWTF